MIKPNKNSSRKKIRVNITVDSENLEKAKKKLNLFGGKLSTLFNLYLSDFVEGMNKNITDSNKEIISKLDDFEARIRKIEEKIK
jgi:hypothetical protein